MLMLVSLAVFKDEKLSVKKGALKCFHRMINSALHFFLFSENREKLGSIRHNHTPKPRCVLLIALHFALDQTRAV